MQENSHTFYNVFCDFSIVFRLFFCFFCAFFKTSLSVFLVLGNLPSFIPSFFTKTVLSSAARKTKRQGRRASSPENKPRARKQAAHPEWRQSHSDQTPSGPSLLTRLFLPSLLARLFNPARSDSKGQKARKGAPFHSEGSSCPVPRAKSPFQGRRQPLFPKSRPPSPRKSR